MEITRPYNYFQVLWVKGQENLQNTQLILIQAEVKCLIKSLD